MKREGRIHKGVSIGAYSILIAFMLLLLWTVLLSLIHISEPTRPY